MRFTCAARRAGADHAARGNPVYQYVLTEILPEPGLAELVASNVASGRLAFSTDLAASVKDAEVVFIAHHTDAKEVTDAVGDRFVADVARAAAKRLRGGGRCR